MTCRDRATQVLNSYPWIAEQMPQTLKIRDFKSVVQYADLEDLPDGTATEMKNMRIIYGKIVKTSELGAFLDEALDVASKTITGFATWIHNRLSASSQPVGSGAGYLYLIAVVDDSTKKLQIYTWNGQSETWVAIDTVAGGLDFTTASYYQTKGDDLPSQRNPIIYANEILRFLPGDTALPDGTNVAVGAWIGWIGRCFWLRDAQPARMAQVGCGEGFVALKRAPDPHGDARQVQLARHHQPIAAVVAGAHQHQSAALLQLGPPIELLQALG